MSVIKQKKSCSLGGLGIHHIEAFYDLSTHHREKWGVKYSMNFWTPCIYLYIYIYILTQNKMSKWTIHLYSPATSKKMFHSNNDMKTDDSPGVCRMWELVNALEISLRTLAVTATESLRWATWESVRDCLDPLLELLWLSRFWSELFMVSEIWDVSQTRESTSLADPGGGIMLPTRDEIVTTHCCSFTSTLLVKM